MGEAASLQHITLSIAKGLELVEYLHHGCDQRILHFDIKPHNVLLDDNFNPKISNFGLAKLCSKDHGVVSMTAARGTMGYNAPEVYSGNFGNVSSKSNAHSFGMLLLEMVGGKDNTNQVYFPEWIRIEQEIDAEIVKKLAVVGLWSIQWCPVDHPSMKAVVQMLEGEGNLSMPPNPFAFSSFKTSIPRITEQQITIQIELYTHTGYPCVGQNLHTIVVRFKS